MVKTSGRLKASLYYNNDRDLPSTGDFVLIAFNPNGDSQIVKILERKFRFARNDFSGHAVISNTLFLVKIDISNFLP